MLSGPDLGAGFLFQLTLDRSGVDPVLIYHAQEGGLDANGPPKGSPVPLGFAYDEGPCPIGGRECFHRRFELEEADLARGRMAYNRIRFVMATMLDQEYGGAPVPVEEGLVEVVDRIAPKLEGAGIPWFIGGEAAAFLQGVPIRPREIRLGTDRAGISAIAEGLSEYLIEPVARSRWGGAGRRFGARAYVGTLQSGVRFGWNVGERSDASASAPLEWAAPVTEVEIQKVEWRGRTLPAVRLEYGVADAALGRGKEALDGSIARLRELGPNLALLDRLLAVGPLSSTERERLRRLVAG